MLVVAVLYEIKPESREAFRDAILKNAAASLRDESECHRFDVSFSPDGLRCFLYELYTDEAAFDSHRRTEHFAEFFQVAQEAAAGKRLETYAMN
jgi:(4S)-4-hydroxy-5-phosphonooxypentane-2,3-dione isomerase